MVRLGHGFGLSVAALVLIVSYQQCTPAQFNASSDSGTVTKSTDGVPGPGAVDPGPGTAEPPGDCLATVKSNVRNIAAIGDDHVQICHVPPGDPSNKHTIVIGKAAVAAHLSHHDDFVGACDQKPPVSSCD
jgi:hypothetical protein